MRGCPPMLAWRTDPVPQVVMVCGVEIDVLRRRVRVDGRNVGQLSDRDFGNCNCSRRTRQGVQRGKLRIALRCSHGELTPVSSQVVMVCGVGIDVLRRRVRVDGRNVGQLSGSGIPVTAFPRLERRHRVQSREAPCGLVAARLRRDGPQRRRNDQAASASSGCER